VKGKKTILGVVMFFAILTGSAWAGMAVPVSPGGGTELTAQSCPTFSWSASEGAQSYRVEVYEQVTSDIIDRDSMRGIGNPVIAREISAPALSWTPSSGECLSRGMRYVWYVEGVDAKRKGQWSEGQGFQVEAAALSVEQKEAVQEVVRDYVTGDLLDETSKAAGSDTTGETSEQAGTASAITPQSIEEGTYNTAFGTNAAHDMIGAGTFSTGTQGHVFIGADAGYSTVAGTGGTIGNSFFGYRAGYLNTTGGYNSFIGHGAGRYNTTGYNNSFLGYMAGYRNTVGFDNTFIGHRAGYSNISGSFNSFVGYQAGYRNAQSPEGFPSSYNSFVGYQAGYSNIYGDHNSFFGYRAGYSNSTSDYNSFFGHEAGYNNSGERNSFFGTLAGHANNDGDSNSFFGAWSGMQNTTGSGNSFFGYLAGYANTEGHGNVFLGVKAGYHETGSDKLYIDNCYTGGSSCTQPFIKGDFAARTLQIDGSLTIVTMDTPSDIRYKKDIHPLKSSLEKVLELRGVAYEWDKDKVHGAGFKEGRQIGLIAQEVEKVLPELVHTDSDGYKTLSYDKLGPVLIEAVKEQQKEITYEKREIAEKDARIERLEKALQKQKKSLETQQAMITAMMARLAAMEHPAKTLALK
jgi:hypothetical protein